MEGRLNLQPGISNTFIACLLFSAILVPICYIIARNYKTVCASAGIIGALRPVKTLSRSVREPKIDVSFLAQSDDSLPWTFKSNIARVKLAPGEIIKVSYTAKNMAAYSTAGEATYNVVPLAAAKYFNKIQCFCFSRIYIPPKATINLPLVFYISPAFCLDETTRNIKEITLAYVTHKT